MGYEGLRAAICEHSVADCIKKIFTCDIMVFYHDLWNPKLEDQIEKTFWNYLKTHEDAKQDIINYLQYKGN